MIPQRPVVLLIFQLLAHLALIPMILYGTWWQWAIVLIVYFLNGCLGMTMTYHRLLSHKSWSPPTWLEYLFVFFATIGLTGSAIAWVAVHRKHHAFVDTEKDPHGPTIRGYFWCHFLSMFSAVELKYASHLLKRKFYIMQHKYYYEVNIVYALLLLYIDPFAVVYAWLVPAMLLWNAGSSIISISHRKGIAHNDTILAFSVWGEGYHKNHHDHPSNFRFGQYDLGGILIKTFNHMTCNDKS